MMTSYALDSPPLVPPRVEDVVESLKQCFGPVKRSRDDFEFPLKTPSERQARKRPAAPCSVDRRVCSRPYTPLVPIAGVV